MMRRKVCDGSLVIAGMGWQVQQVNDWRCYVIRETTSSHATHWREHCTVGEHSAIDIFLTVAGVILWTFFYRSKSDLLVVRALLAIKISLAASTFSKK